MGKDISDFQTKWAAGDYYGSGQAIGKIDKIVFKPWSVNLALYCLDMEIDVNEHYGNCKTDDDCGDHFVCWAPCDEFGTCVPQRTISLSQRMLNTASTMPRRLTSTTETARLMLTAVRSSTAGLPAMSSVSACQTPSKNSP